MRHLTGLLLALVMSAALFFGAGWGVARIVALRGTATGLPPAHALTSMHGLLAVAAVAGAGLLLGIMLAAPRISPLGTGLPGLVLLGWSALMVVHSRDTLRYLPLPGSAATTGLVFLLLHGVLALAGAAMIMPILIPSRWRRREYYVEDGDINVPAELGLVP